MSRPNRVRSASAAVRARWTAVSGGLTVWLCLCLIARSLIAREDQLPGGPRPTRRSAQMVCADCDKRITPEKSPSGQLTCPGCGGQHLRES
jgi:Zn finger protein HypA/HybF involved in hydrogenase expression